MRFIKLGVISIVFFSIFLTLFSFVFPSHIRISKALEIRTEKDSLLHYLTDSSCLAQWNSSGHMKPQNVSIHNDSILVEMDRTDPAAGFNVMPAPVPVAFTVQYYLDFHLHWYPWEKFASLLMERKYGTVMEKDLDKLRSLLEKK